MSKKGIFLGYLFFVVLIIGAYFLFRKDDVNVLKQQTERQEEEIQTIVIETGDGLDEIGQKLEQNNLIKNNFIFKLYTVLAQAKNKFWPGEYQIKSGASLKELIASLTSKIGTAEKTVTITEGLTNGGIGGILQEQGIIDKESFQKAIDEAVNDASFLLQYDFLSQAVEEYKNNPLIKEKLQGYLFPDTYRFFSQTEGRIVIKKMLDNFQKKVSNQLGLVIKQSGHTFNEIVIMASLIEKEAALEQDRRLISDVFWNRIKVGWALESCASVNYILESPKTRLTFEDTRTLSPYNTYLNQGLPIGPINNPSFSSISAAAEPIENNYCCFLSTLEGKIIFSKTIEEHNRNKLIYLE